MNDYRILVVDDEEDLCEILKFNLEMEGYMVDTANSAEEALKLELPRYNLILLDVMMGEISGFKMASMMKRTRIHRIFLSFHHCKGYGERYADRIQPGSGRLYFKAFLSA